jgi:hypothetical protein
VRTDSRGIMPTRPASVLPGAEGCYGTETVGVEVWGVAAFTCTKLMPDTPGGRL